MRLTSKSVKCLFYSFQDCIFLQTIINGKWFNKIILETSSISIDSFTFTTNFILLYQNAMRTQFPDEIHFSSWCSTQTYLFDGKKNGDRELSVLLRCKFLNWCSMFIECKRNFMMNWKNVDMSASKSILLPKEEKLELFCCFSKFWKVDTCYHIWK